MSTKSTSKSTGVVRILHHHHHQHQRVSIACSICGATFAGVVRAVKDENASQFQFHNANAAAAVVVTNATTTGTTTTTSTARPRRRQQHPPLSAALTRIGLESSFVNIPRSFQPTATGGDENNHESWRKKTIHDVESILDHALRLSSNNKEGIMQNSTGANMHEASRRMDAFLQFTVEILSWESSTSNNAMEDKDDVHQQQQQSYCCQSCLGMISQAMDTCSELYDEECITYDTTASSEEERTFMMCNALSADVDFRGVSLDDVDGQHHDDDAIHHAIELFQSELNALSNACNEQEKELRVLQNLMRTQMDRSKAISDQEDIIHQELNSLELEAHNFEEESHLVIYRCNAVEDEIAAMSSVKLLSIPFKIRIDSGGDDSIQNSTGRYPTINNLRLAYRINTKAGLHKEEINAAFFHAAQFMAFTLGLYPSLNTTVIRIIPIHPCAKILVNLPEGQTVHNLGFDTNGGDSNVPSNHVPTQSIALFLALLSEVTSYILKERAQRSNNIDEPPFPMTELSIDNVDVTNLADSNIAAWSSVVFCIAANLHWLSELEMGW